MLPFHLITHCAVPPIMFPSPPPSLFTSARCLLPPHHSLLAVRQYLVWELAWLSWNVFVICFYLNVGVLENSRDWLNFGTGSASWWEVSLSCFTVLSFKCSSKCWTINFVMEIRYITINRGKCLFQTFSNIIV